jgi:hypothetical protein
MLVISAHPARPDAASHCLNSCHGIITGHRTGSRQSMRRPVGHPQRRRAQSPCRAASRRQAREHLVAAGLLLLVGGMAWFELNRGGRSKQWNKVKNPGASRFRSRAGSSQALMRIKSVLRPYSPMEKHGRRGVKRTLGQAHGRPNHPGGSLAARQHPLSFFQCRLLDSRRLVDSFSWPSATHLAVGK